jgi:orotate phosphoribosyltransferase
VTSGGQNVPSTADLRVLGASVAHAVCVIDRAEGGGAWLAAHGIELRAAFTRVELERSR